MRYLSASSISTDAYLAGVEIGESLAPIRPEVVLVFASLSYGVDLPELFRGLRDAVGRPELLIFGGTGDGVYETQSAAHYAVAALGIDSAGAIHWESSVEPGVGADSAGATRRCATRALEALGGPPDFCFVLADGTTADGTQVVAGISSVVSGPVFGGLAGDDRRFHSARVFQGERDHVDSVAVLLGRGPLPWAVSAASGWQPVGVAGRVEAVDGCEIHRIGSQSAGAFVTDQVGKPLGQIDLGIIPLAAYPSGLEGAHFLRSPSRMDEDGSLTTFGSIPKGTLVRACTATREDVLRGVSLAVRALREGRLGFEPKAALVVSCAGRKWLLEDRGEREISALFEALGAKIPMVGFPSFGEISPLRTPAGTYSEPYFHNVTFGLALLGE